MELPQQQQKDGPWKEWFLDLKGTCFLCLKDPASASDTEPASTSGGGRVSLREICRYFEINELQQSGFAVALCEPCVTHFNKLIGLIHEMEDIQKRLAHQLQQFHGILEGSLEEDQSKQQWEKILNKNPITAGFAGCLRKEAGDKCQEKMKYLATKVDAPEAIQGTSSTASQPNETSVNSTSTETNKANASDNSRIEPITTTARELSTNLPSSRKRSRADDRDDLHTDNPRKKLESSRDVVMRIFDQNCRTSKDEGFLHFDCLHCEGFVTGDAQKIRKHLLTDHPETLFPSTKAPNLSDKMFVDCVKELLKTETEAGRVEAKSRKIFKGKNSNKESPLYCIPCERTYKHGTDYRYHLIVGHYDTLKQKLAHVQENFSGRKLSMSSRILPSRRRRREKKIEDKEVEEFKCAVEEGGCGRMYSNRKCLQQHKKESCPKNQLEAIWVCKPEDGGCGKSFSRKARLRINQVDSCPKLNRKKNSRGSISRSRSSEEESLDSLEGAPSGSEPGLIQLSVESHEGSFCEGMEEAAQGKLFLEKGLRLEGEKASGTAISSAFSGNDVKEEIEEKSSLEFSETADSTTAEDDLFECNVFAIKSE